MSAQSMIARILADSQSILLKEWMELQTASSTRRVDLISEQDLKRQSEEFLHSLRKGLESGDIADLDGSAWEDSLRFLASLSRSSAERGFSPSETATFVFSLKEPLFRHLKADLRGEADEFMEAAWTLTLWMDKLGLYTTEAYTTSRQQIIIRQQEELLELSTPVVKIWDGVLVLPLIGTLDSARTQSVMESLLQQIVATESRVAIIDITGVPTVDTLVAQHLLKTVAAARLMGAECVISGIRPQIAQTMVHLGVGFDDVTTKATMAEALRHAFKLYGYVVTKSAPRS